MDSTTIELPLLAKEEASSLLGRVVYAGKDGVMIFQPPTTPGEIVAALGIVTGVDSAKGTMTVTVQGEVVGRIPEVPRSRRCAGCGTWTYGCPVPLRDFDFDETPDRDLVRWEEVTLCGACTREEIIKIKGE